jgi:hypothetical protein
MSEKKKPQPDESPKWPRWPKVRVPSVPSWWRDRLLGHRHGWQWSDRIAVIYAAWLFAGGIFAIAKIVLYTFFGVPLEPMFPLPNF